MATETGHKLRMGKTGRDIITLGVAIAAILLFVGTGSSVLPQAIRSLTEGGPGPDQLLTNALILNIALVIFGWRRYRELTEEVRERAVAEDQARKLAETDPLTGSLNRRAITPAAEALQAEAAKAGQVLAWIMVDLDNFKQVNDFNGHGAGDAILIESARRIRSVLPADALVARIGGDEFACVLRFDPAQPDMVDRKAAALIETVSRPIQASGIPIETTVSIGVTRSDQPGEGAGERDATALMHMADIAMYHAKKAGRNRYFWFEPMMESSGRRS